MSTDTVDAAAWVADLEDVLGLSPIGSRRSVVDGRSLARPARARLIYLTIAGVGLSTVLVGVAGTGLVSIIGDRFPRAGQSAPSQPRRESLDPSRVSPGTDAVQTWHAGRNAGPAVASLVQSEETSRATVHEIDGARRREGPPTSFHERRQRSQRASDVGVVGEAGTSPTMEIVGREIAAAPDRDNPRLDAERDTPLPADKPIGDDARLAIVPLSLLQPSETPEGSRGQKTRAMPDKAGVALVPADPKTSLKNKGAIDAIRMLRRQ